MTLPAKIYLPGGKPLIVGGKFHVRAENCCCVPCTCPGGLAALYRIADYLDTLFDPSGCGCNDSADAPWDGTFSGGSCTWLGPAVPYSINGKAGDWRGLFPFGRTGLSLVPCALVNDGAGPAYWQLYVRCEGGGAGHEIWRARKSIGATPVGVYARESGCSAGPSSVLVTT